MLGFITAPNFFITLPNTTLIKNAASWNSSEEFNPELCQILIVEETAIPTNIITLPQSHNETHRRLMN